VSGIYFHIPYCKKACHYCDFHFSTVLNTREEMVAAMLSELELRKAELALTTVESIYFGGGTPSILSTKHIAELLSTVRSEFTVSDQAEITLEANPDDLTKTALQDWKDIGINRLSIGLQSFHDADLTWMNRAHNSQEALNAVWEAREIGFQNLTVDLIYGLPNWVADEWAQNLAELKKLNVPHFSAYILTVEEKTALGVKVNKGLERVATDVQIEGEYSQLTAFAKEQGYQHYEVSNFALPGERSRHNGNYWKGAAYLGIGPGAHSFDGKTRRWNVSNNNRYINALKSDASYFETELLSRYDQYNEHIMTRLRTAEGIDLAESKSLYGLRPDQVEPLFWNDLVKEGSVIEINGRFRVTENAWLVSDRIASDLFAI